MRGSETYFRPGTTQTVGFTGTAGTIATAMGSGTHTIRVFTTADAFISIGVTPTAAATDMPIAAGIPEYFTISPGEKVSAIQQSAGGNLYVTEMTQ